MPNKMVVKFFKEIEQFSILIEEREKNFVPFKASFMKNSFNKNQFNHYVSLPRGSLCLALPTQPNKCFDSRFFFLKN